MPRRASMKHARQDETNADVSRAAKRTMPDKHISKGSDGPMESSDTAEALRVGATNPAEDSPEASSKPKLVERVPKGPNGEAFLPCILPEESIDLGDKQVLPAGWASYDGTPGRVMTVNNPRWWKRNAQWLDRHWKSLGLSQDQQQKGLEAMKETSSPENTNLLQDQDWICICRPYYDYQAQREDEGNSAENEEDVSDEEEPDSCLTCGEQCMAEQPPDRNLLHVWVATVLGSERRVWWQQEAMKRDPGLFDMYIYNDFASYGALEVLENALYAFHVALVKKKSNLISIWAEIEGLAFNLADGGSSRFIMCDDSERCKAFVRLIGAAVITVMDGLLQKGQFKPGSVIRNLGLVLTLFLSFAQEQSSTFDGGETDWRFAIIECAEKHGVELSGPYGSKALIEEVKQDMDGSSFDYNVKWREELLNYKEIHNSGNSSRYRIGGNNFDITRFSKAERKEYSFIR